MGFEVVVSRRAERDLEDIFRFSVAEWSIRTANAYILDLRRAIDELSIGPARSSAIDDIAPDHRQTRVRSHLIIHRQAGSRILVLRVLHVRMDVRRHL